MVNGSHRLVGRLKRSPIGLQLAYDHPVVVAKRLEELSRYLIAGSAPAMIRVKGIMVGKRR